MPSTKPTHTATYYLDVAPKLSLQDSLLPITSLSICSIISKLMGKDSTEGDHHLRGIGQRGYNMVHFTPLMIRGSSNSPYSLYDMITFDKTSFPNGEKDVAVMIAKMEKDYGLLGMTDIVLNHTANNSHWLQDHPDAGYNVKTAPWLEAAEELDLALLNFGKNLASLGLPTELKSEYDLNRVMEAVKSKCIADLRLWEYYVVDVERDLHAAVKSWSNGNDTLPSKGGREATLNSVDGAKAWSSKQKVDWLLNNALAGNDRMGERFRRTLQPHATAVLITALSGDFKSHPAESGVTNAIKNLINDLNVEFYREYDSDLGALLSQLFDRTKYLRLADHGPKSGPINDENPLFESYFTRLPVNETTKKHDPKSLALANNGWIWAADAMKDNAGQQSRAYLRREVIVWADCVKLRYGSGPDDSPFLWNYMSQYVRLMAKYFSGFRIDNCHSTPIHVAEHMLDQARSVRPNLAVFAELFSGSEAMDFVFVQRLGLSALIREAMSAGSPADLSRLVHMHGGDPIGTFSVDEVINADNDGAVVGPIIHKIRQSDVHALFFDCTHDNEPPAQKRVARDTLSNSALVAMCSCATGSVMGYDEIYPELINLVTETRLYTSAFSSGAVVVAAGEGGIGGIKKLLNQIHALMGKDGYTETYIDHKDQYITVHRVQPQSRKGYFLIAHTAFPGYGNGSAGLPPVRLGGSKVKSLGSWKLEVNDSTEARADVTGNKSKLTGLPSHTTDVQGVNVEYDDGTSVISIPDSFSPGSIALFETWMPAAEHTEGLDKFVTSGAKAAFKDLKLRHLNFVLYRCDPEERDASHDKDGCYNVPSFGPLVYAGLQGWWSVLRNIVRENDLGHPLCQHLRDGHWALDYCVGRLEVFSKIDGYSELQGPAKWLRERFIAIRKIPSFLLPRYFAMVIQTAYSAARDRCIEQMSENIQNGPEFLKSLALVSVQMSGYMRSTSLYPKANVPCLAAGLPHFSHDWARCWGRDVFISIRGLLLSTGRFTNAREHILAFGSVLKHGLIPNLLGSGKITRYNSRDSIWFFLQSIQDYTKMAPNGSLILTDSVKRRFLPYDDTWFPWDDDRAYSQSSTVEDIIQEAMSRHAEGISFREANAGPQIDSNMKDEGFNIKIDVNWDNGIIFGGNQYNCGTWMDNLGSSEKAGNRGIPATPRDGAAIEISALLYSTLVWLAQANADGKYSYAGVKVPGATDIITFKDWACKIKGSFEKCYWIPSSPQDDIHYDVNPQVVNRRGIYKDVYKSSREWQDYQLRPNFPIAMAVAPDLFDPTKALHALSVADTLLRKPVGMATLDSSDLTYRPYYNNNDDTTDFATSKGFNYHRGPPWNFPLGFFLRALLKFDLMRRTGPEERVETFQQISRRLHGCQKMIRDSAWGGLVELNNGIDEYCPGASPTQAWSAGCLLDLYTDAQAASHE